jgi:hypothetical protein
MLEAIILTLTILGLLALDFGTIITPPEKRAEARLAQPAEPEQ